jgi:hypothetical protein
MSARDRPNLKDVLRNEEEIRPRKLKAKYSSGFVKKFVANPMQGISFTNNL